MRTIYLATLALSLCALMTAQKASKRKPQPQPDPEARWMCHIGSYHECHCPAMVAEEQEKAVEQCANTTKTRAEYLACVSKAPSECEIIQKPDTVHPEHTCKRSCTHAKCQCWDGPPCAGPTVYTPSNSSDEANQ